MGHVSVADWVVAVEFMVALLALIYFVIGYIASSAGRALKTPEGRHLVNFRGSLAVFMAMGAVHNLVDDYPGRDAVRIIVIGWFVVATLQGNLLMTRAQWRLRLLRRDRMNRP